MASRGVLGNALAHVTAPGQSRGQLTLYRVICGIESRTCKSSPGVTSLPRTAFLANARDDHPLCITSTKIRVLPSSYFVQDSSALSTDYSRSLSSSSIAHRMLDAPLPRVCPPTNGDLVGPDLLTACRTRCHFSLILLNQPIPQGECRQGHVPLFADLLEDD